MLKFGGSLVEQLGAQLYPSVTATVAELISNAWDADAENVWVTIPFEEDWSSGADIVVLDDGHGMTRRQAQETYLVVGRRKRSGPLGDRSESGRLVHGRKGIGKLAAFGTAGYLECVTVRDGQVTAFGIDYDELRRLNPDQNYYVESVFEVPPLRAPSGRELTQGTRIRLSKLRVKRKISAGNFRLSMSRRFAIRGMNVFINGEPLRRFDIPLQYKLPRDHAPGDVTVDEEGWALEYLPSGDLVRWWIGFTEKPLADGDQQGMSVLARQKMAQRPFKFEKSQGTTSQLGFEYLVGEVEADWLDQGEDIDSDYIQSNRDQLQLENERLDEFIHWGQRRLAWALRVRGELKTKEFSRTFEEQGQLDEIIGPVSARERRALHSVAEKLAKIPEVDQTQVRQLMTSIVGARAEAQLDALSSEIKRINGSSESELWSLLRQTGELDARRLTGVLDSRIAAIENLIAWLGDSLDPAQLLTHVKADVWILDPRLHLFSEPVDMQELAGLKGIGSSPFEGLLVLKPSQPAPVDEIAIVQLVAGSGPDSESVRVFARRAQQIADRLQVATSYRGTYVAPGFDDAARKAIDELEPKGILRFFSWREALENSLAMHRGWRVLAHARSLGHTASNP